MKANSCEIKTWREQFFPGKKGSKRCPCVSTQCPQKGGSTLNHSGHQAHTRAVFQVLLCFKV